MSRWTSGITGIGSSADLSLNGPLAFVAASGTNTTSNSALTGLSSNLGTFQLIGGASLTTTGGLSNSGVVLLDNVGGGGSTLSIGGTLSNSNEVQVGNGGISSAATLTAQGLSNTGRIDIAGGSATAAATFVVNGAADNSGMDNIGAFGVLNVTGLNAYTQSGGSTTVTGTLTAASVDVTGGNLGGIGTVVGNVSDTGGTVLGGAGPAAPGILTVQGNYSQSGSGVLQLDMNGTAAGDVSTVDISGGSVDLQGGTLAVNVLSPFTLALGHGGGRS